MLVSHSSEVALEERCRMLTRLSKSLAWCLYRRDVQTYIDFINFHSLFIFAAKFTQAVITRGELYLWCLSLSCSLFMGTSFKCHPALLSAWTPWFTSLLDGLTQLQYPLLTNCIYFQQDLASAVECFPGAVTSWWKQWQRADCSKQRDDLFIHRNITSWEKRVKITKA